MSDWSSDVCSSDLHYHQFALGPLVMMAETMTRNGEPDAYVWNDNRLNRLAMPVVAGLEDPEWFAGRAGEKQDMAVTIKTTQLAWMEPWQARSPEPRPRPRSEDRREEHGG